MGFSSGNEKIDKYLSELSDEYKELLFKALLEKSSSIDNLNISELLRIDNEIKKTLRKDYRKVQRKNNFLFTAGIIYLFIGLIVYVFYNTFFRTNNDVISIISVVVGFTGLGIILYVYFSTRIFTMSVYADSFSNSKDISFAYYEVVSKWRELEGIANDLNINEDKSASFSIIQFYFDNQYINVEEAKVLKEFLKLRNDIIHTSTPKYTLKEIKTVIDKINLIITKIQKLV